MLHGNVCVPLCNCSIYNNYLLLFIGAVKVDQYDAPFLLAAAARPSLTFLSIKQVLKLLNEGRIMTATMLVQAYFFFSLVVRTNKRRIETNQRRQFLIKNAK